MSTPNSPGPQLPDESQGSPTSPERAPATETSPETTSVLQRLRAARPQSAGAEAGPGDDAPSAPRPAPRSDPKVGPGSRGRTDGTSGAGSPGTTGPAQQDGGTGPAPARRISPERAEQLRLAARTAGRGAQRAARQAGVAAWVTGRAIGRGSTVAGRAVGRGGSAAVGRARTWDPDTVRRCVVTMCAVACILGSAAGVGAFGGPSIQDAAGGLFSPDATLLAPSSTAFSIWSVIYAGLIAYTAFQWLPSQRTSARQRRIGWKVAASMILNLAWILGAQSDHLVLSLVIILLLLFTLLAVMHVLNAYPPTNRLESILVDIPLGLYLGWVLVAASANAAALLTARGVDLFGWHGTAWAIIGIIAVLVTAAVVCSTDRGRFSVAAAVSWGLFWIAVERGLGEPFALDVALVAALAIFLLLITAGARRHRVDHAARRSLRAEEDARREPLDLLAGREDDEYEDSRY